jgi:two-component system cell cycle response regulator CpdR
VLDIYRQYIARRRSRPSSALKVLIVDDEPPICAFADRVLREGGYTTEIAFDGSAALEKCELTGPFDVLLTDENMPRIRGHELAARMRLFDPDIKVLYLTGYCDLLFNERGTLWEGEAFLEKPVSARALREAVSLLVCDRVGE